MSDPSSHDSKISVVPSSKVQFSIDAYISKENIIEDFLQQSEQSYRTWCIQVSLLSNIHGR